MIRTVGLVLALAATSAAATAATAGIPSKDGALPIYPRASIASPTAFPTNFWTSGAYREMAFLLFVTQDDESAVDAWYRPRLGTYTRKTISDHGRGGSYWEGPGSIVKVEATAGTAFAKYGKTMILLDPAK